MSDPQFPMPVGTPVYSTAPPVVAPPVNPGPLPPGVGSPGPGQPGFPGGQLPDDGNQHNSWMGGGLPGGFERGKWFARFLQRHPDFLTKHPDFLTNHPRIATNVAAYNTAHPPGTPVPVPAPGPGGAPSPVPTPVPAPPVAMAPTDPVSMPTSPQANTVGGMAGAPNPVPTTVRPAFDGGAGPRPMAGPSGTGVPTGGTPGMTAGANAIINARTRPPKARQI